jgi:hypothetical protein
MKKQIFTTWTIPFLFCATVALAAPPLAELSQVQGKVLVNQGKGFYAAIGAKALNAGDQVMVSADSSVIISLAKGCSVAVSKPSVVRIDENMSCKASPLVFEGDSFVAPAGTVITPTASRGSTNLALPIAMGGVAALGTIVFFATQNNNNESVSAPAQ